MSFDFSAICQCLWVALTFEAGAFILYLRMRMPSIQEYGRASQRFYRIQIIAGFVWSVLCVSTWVCFHRWKHVDDEFTDLAVNVGIATVCERLGAESNECSLTFRRSPDGIVLSGSRHGTKDGSVSILVTKDPLGVYTIKE